MSQPPPPPGQPPPGHGPPPGGHVPGGRPYPDNPRGDERTWAIVAHLSGLVALFSIPSVVGPLVVWLIRRPSGGRDVPHAREALNFHLSLAIYGAVAVVFALVTLGFGVIVLIPVIFVVGIVALIFMIIAASRAGNGELYRYPLTLRLIKS